MTCFLIEVQKSKVRKGWARGGDEGKMGWWISRSNDYGYNKTLGLQILAAAWILIYSNREMRNQKFDETEIRLESSPQESTKREKQ